MHRSGLSYSLHHSVAASLDGRYAAAATVLRSHKKCVCPYLYIACVCTHCRGCKVAGAGDFKGALLLFRKAAESEAGQTAELAELSAQCCMQLEQWDEAFECALSPGPCQAINAQGAEAASDMQAV